jgi:tRNA1(Val) A37 N6-methylase TrmN6
VESIALSDWVKLSLKRVKPKGSFSIIHRADRLDDILAAMQGCGNIRVLPIAARAGRDAKRVLIQCVKDSRAPLRLLPPLIMHDGASHDRDGDDYSTAARAILRDAAALNV